MIGKIAISLAMLAFVPLLAAHFASLWSQERYQFFPILLCGIVGIAAYRGIRPKHFMSSFQSGLSFSEMLFLGGLGMLLLATLVDEPNIAMVGWMVFTAGFVWRLSTSNGMSLWGPWALGWILVELPGSVRGRLVGSLQAISSQLSSSLLDWVGVNHLNSGNVFHLASQDLFVAEACSGVVSLFSILAFGCLYAVYHQYSALRTTLLIAIGCCCTLLLNVLRITSIAFAGETWDFDLAHGIAHEILGITLFLFVLGVFYSADQVLGLFLKPIDRRAPGSQPGRLVKIWNWATADGELQPTQSRNSRIVNRSSGDKQTMGYLLMAMALVVICSWVGRMVAFPSVPSVASITEPLRIAVVSNLAVDDTNYEFVQRDRTSQDGEFSRVFNFVLNDEMRPSFSVDYAFSGNWHELAGCYISTGWKSGKRQVQRSTSANDYLEVDFEKLDGQYGFLLFSIADTRGNHVASKPKMSTSLTWMLGDFQRRFWHGFTGEVLQYQLWCPSDRPLSADEKEALRAEFLRLRSVAQSAMFPADN